MFGIYKKLYTLFDARERRRGAVVLLLALLVGVSETAGVASIMPFIAVLSNPRVVQSNRYLGAVYRWLGFTSIEPFLLFLGVAVFVVLVGSLILRAVGLWAQIRFAQQRSHRWACSLVAGYLGQSYEWFLNRHTGELSASILAEVDQVVNGALRPALQTAASGFVAVWLLALLVAVNPALCLAAVVGMGGLYGVAVYASRAALERIGGRWRKVLRVRFRLLQEILGGVKDVKVLGLEATYHRRFARENRELVNAQISSQIIRQLPSLAMQGVLFGGILLTVLYLMASHHDFEEALPTLTVFAFAGYRLMPALQKLYQSVSQMRFSEAAVDALRRDLESFEHLHLGRILQGEPRPDSLVVHEAVELRDIWYTYPGAPHPALRGVSLRIPVRSAVGFVGSTGSGKTTLVDVLLGLLHPQSGALVLDDVGVTEDLIPRWQRYVGYVPQQIFLSDDTVEANIAFGVSPRDIDKGAVERAARAAGLHEFISRELPEGYETTVGERGVRLSGGQRQRIGIARALYRDPELLIFDEATSSLDNLTEQAVMGAVHNLEGTKTIILIAHRLSTVRGCDCIYLMEEGKVVASGPYEQLIAESPEFRALAELA